MDPDPSPLECWIRCAITFLPAVESEYPLFCCRGGTKKSPRASLREVKFCHRGVLVCIPDIRISIHLNRLRCRTEMLAHLTVSTGHHAFVGRKKPECVKKERKGRKSACKCEKVLFIASFWHLSTLCESWEIHKHSAFTGTCAAEIRDLIIWRAATVTRTCSQTSPR